MSRRIWILGAADPEMEMIEALLRECGEHVAYACSPEGKRCHPGNAYTRPVSVACAKMADGRWVVDAAEAMGMRADSDA